MPQKKFLDDAGLTELLDELGQYLKGKQDILTAGNGIAIDNSDTIRTIGIPYGVVDSTSTSKVFTATVPGIDRLENGVCVMLKNGVVTSAAGFTININGLGAKPAFNNMTAATRETTIFNINYTMLFVYDATRVVDSITGAWVCYRGYDANINTIGFQLRTNSTVMTVTDTARYYKIYFTSADGAQWVPASVNSTNNATSARAVNQRPINPFGRIVFTSANSNYAAGTNLAATTIWDQYTLTLGYSFNRTDAALTLTTNTPVYVKCAPQTNGSAIMDADTPIVQALPTTNDGKIYIFLGVAYSATAIELVPNHPVYYHDGSGIKLWTGSTGGGGDLSNYYTKSEVNSAIVNFTPIIEDTRTSDVVAITGIAPFASLVDKQQILLHSKYMNSGSGAYTLNLTLSDNTTTGAKNIKYVSKTATWSNASGNMIRSGAYIHLIYDQTKDAWLLDLDYDTTYEAIGTAEINIGTATVGRLISAKVLRDNFYLKSEINTMIGNIETLLASI